MLDEDALLRAISQDLYDDTPRLVYAQWLDENCNVGEPGWPQNEHGFSARAEFIRRQIEADTKGVEDPRAQQLLAEHRAEWEAPIRQALGQSCKEVQFRRGFPCMALLSTISELLTSEILERETNTLTGLTVRHLGNQLPQLLSRPGIARLSTLELGLGWNNIGEAGAEAIAASPHLAKLTTLGLWGNDIGDAGARAIAASPYLSLAAKLSGLRSAGFDVLATQVERDEQRPGGHPPPP